MNIREFFQKRKAIQSSLEEWENRGLEIVAMQDARANQQRDTNTIKPHPLLQNVHEKRDAYKQSIEMFREAETSLSNGRGDALKAEIQNQFSDSAGELPPQNTISYSDLQDKYVALLERMAGMERSLSELKEGLSQEKETPLQHNENQPQRSVQEILDDGYKGHEPAQVQQGNENSQGQDSGDQGYEE